MQRFSDTALRELDRKIDDHVRSHNKFVAVFYEHEVKEMAYHDMQRQQISEIVEITKQNAEAVGDLTKEVAKLSADTRDVVALHKDFQGFARIATRAQNVIFWLMKWGTIGTSLGLLMMWLIDKMNEL